MRRLGLACAGLLLVGLVGVAVYWLAGGFRDRAAARYTQGSAQEVLDSALRMVKDNRADLLPKLIYADSREARLAMQRLGALLGNVQKMGLLVAEKFPAETKAVRDSMIEAAGGLSIGVGPGSVGGDEADEADEPSERPAGAEGAGGGAPSIATDPASQRRQRRGAELIAQRVFANPLGFITDNERRLSVRQESDDAAVVLLDGQPIAGGLVRIERRAERWWLMLPLNLPVVQQYAPQTRGEWLIVGDVIRVFDNLVVDLSAELRDGKLQNLTHISNRAGEMLFGPAALAIVAYVKEMSHRTAREEGMSQLRPRLREWTRARAALGEDPEVSRKLQEVVRRAAAEGLDRIARAHLAGTKDPGSKPTFPPYRTMSLEELTLAFDLWLRESGAELPLSSALTAEMVEQAAEVMRKAPLAPAKDP